MPVLRSALEEDNVNLRMQVAKLQAALQKANREHVLLYGDRPTSSPSRARRGTLGHMSPLLPPFHTLSYVRIARFHACTCDTQYISAGTPRAIAASEPSALS